MGHLSTKKKQRLYSIPGKRKDDSNALRNFIANIAGGTGSLGHIPGTGVGQADDYNFMHWGWRSSHPFEPSFAWHRLVR